MIVARHQEDQIINFSNIGFEIIPISLTQEEIDLVNANAKKTKNLQNKSIYSHLSEDSTTLFINLIGNKLSIYDVNNTILFTKELIGNDYIFCVGDFNLDHNDELILYDKSTGLTTIESWNSSQNNLMTISNCKFPQNQFIEYIAPITMNKVTYLLVFRGSDKTIILYSIDF